MIEGSGSRSIHPTNGSGSGRPKNHVDPVDPDPEHCLLDIVRIDNTGYLTDSVDDCIVSILLWRLFFSSQIPDIKKIFIKKYFLTNS